MTKRKTPSKASIQKHYEKFIQFNPTSASIITFEKYVALMWKYKL